MNILQFATKMQTICQWWQGKERVCEPQIATFEWWCMRLWRFKREWVSVVSERCRVFMYCSVLVEDLFGFFPLVRNLIMNSISFHSTTPCLSLSSMISTIARLSSSPILQYSLCCLSFCTACAFFVALLKTIKKIFRFFYAVVFGIYVCHVNWGVYIFWWFG